MRLRTISVVGEALNFGGRRMETIARVAWLPVALLLIVNMTTVFAFLSVIVGRVVTFADVGTFSNAQWVLGQYAQRGWEHHFGAMAAISAGNLVLQTLLIASFMAPLIRYAGLGEKPAPGVVRLAFGPDQIRYILSGMFSFLFIGLLILGPMAAATFFALKYVLDAMTQTMASFPDPDSLHTITFVTAADSLKAKGAGWIFDIAVPLAVVAPLALLLWFLVFHHFHPRNRPKADDAGNPILRALATLIVVVALLAGVYWLFHGAVQNYMNVASSLYTDSKTVFTDTPTMARLWLGALIFIFIGYFNLRLYPYPGVAVCRKSMGLGETLQVSRGWNIIRLQIVLILITVFLFIVQVVFLNLILFKALYETLSALYNAVSVTTRLVNSGTTAEWVSPLFIWIWNGIKISINILWTFFSYGVAAGLYGRLYKESERMAAA